MTILDDTFRGECRCALGRRGCPKLARKEIKHYVPKMKRSSDWDAIIEMVNSIEDDGHTAELVRALVQGQGIFVPWKKSEISKIKDK